MEKNQENINEFDAGILTRKESFVDRKLTKTSMWAVVIELKDV